MDKIIAFYNRYKNELLWALVGALALFAAVYSYQLLIAAGALLFGAQQTQAKAGKKRREQIKDIHQEAQDFDVKVEELQVKEQEQRSAAGKKAAKDVDDFIDGEW
jgi:uncharacterized cupredoxin-like copper-binding protein